MKTAKVFRNGRSLAVRIPREWLGDAREVESERIGDAIKIRPRQATLDALAKRFARTPIHLERVPQSTTPPPRLSRYRHADRRACANGSIATAYREPETL